MHRLNKRGFPLKCCTKKRLQTKCLVLWKTHTHRWIDTTMSKTTCVFVFQREPTDDVYRGNRSVSQQLLPSWMVRVVRRDKRGEKVTDRQRGCSRGFVQLLPSNCDLPGRANKPPADRRPLINTLSLPPPPPLDCAVLTYGAQYVPPTLAQKCEATHCTTITTHRNALHALRAASLAVWCGVPQK